MHRRTTRPVRVGGVTIGGGAPVSVQSMTKTHTEQVAATLAQVRELAEVGCEIVRCAVPNRKAAEALGSVVEGAPIPVVADVHFDHRLAMLSLEAGAHGVRVNPGNMKDRDGLREVYRAAAEAGAKVRIGVNSGSVRPRTGLEVRPEAEPPDLAPLMVRGVLEYAHEAEEAGLSGIVLSLKASDAPTTIRAYRMVAEQCDYPLHVGVTAAGPPCASIVKSSVGIGTLLMEGIGDTIRVSMTGPPHEEVAAGIAILQAAGLRDVGGPEVISCPTCGRCEVDLRSVVERVAEAVADLPTGLRIAVMGCVVNGPGEAAEADLGVAGGRDFGYLFRAGRKLRKVPADRLAEALIEEARALAGRRQESDG